jgi:hypothetical protein
MEPIQPTKTIILHPNILKVLRTFDNLVRDGQYMDCISCIQGNYYMEIEAVDQPNHLVTIKLLLPHSMILAVIDSSQKSIVGFGHTEENKEDDFH